MPTVIRVVASAVAVGSLLLLAGCDDEPADGAPTIALTISSENGSTTPGSQGTVFSGVKACDLLAPAIDGTSLGQPKESNLGGPNGCETAFADYGTASLDLHDGKRVDDLVVDRGQISTIQVAGRDARMLAGNGGDGNCQISIAAGPNSRALVALTLVKASTDMSCEDLQPIAEKVADQLPAG